MKAPCSIEPIAVIGLSFRLPGDANDVDGLWKLLESGESAWTPVPEDRYNGEAFYHPNADDPNGTSNHPGGHFISGDVRNFDHSFFKFTKSQAAALDPQQRLLMELSYEALESAGIPQESIAGTATSVYTAIFPQDYQGLTYKDNLDLPVYYMTGVETAIFANRLSHVLDLRGPSMTLDTACSGGLVALHQACQSLREGESDTALVSASNLILGPDHFIGLSNLHMLSSTGRCYPFDERGKGYGRGEGVVVLVLKRLSDAIRDNDPVRTVIRSSAIGQDGYTPQSITYPNGEAQADLARAAYARAGLQPEEVAYIEAHGTGTKAGDREEMKGLCSVFATKANRPVPLYIGSIKGAIGHTESAAGLASFVKATVMLDRELIPPVAGFEKPKPDLPLEQVRIPTKVVPWPHAEGIVPRISINSFGFGGTNAHTILERGPRTIQGIHSQDATSPRLFTLSANSPASLKAMIRSQHSWLERHADSSLVDLSYTLLQRRSALPYRFSAVAASHVALLEALDTGIATAATKPVPAEVDIVMVFTGQGAQWAGMGRELLLETTTRSSSIYRDSIRASGMMLQKLGARWDLETEILRDTVNSRLDQAELAQPATTATQIALVSLLRAQGVRPKAVVGHSSGEIAAAFAAGRLSHVTAIKVAFYRGCMAAAVKTKVPGGGAMLSVGLGEQDAAKYLEGLTEGKAVVACINSPRSVTISGDAAAVDEVDKRIAAADDGTFHRKLLVDTAYHSHHMRTVADDYLARLGSLEIEECGDEDIAFTSSVTGQPKTSGFNAEYFVANFVSPVRFGDAVQALAKSRHRAGQQSLFIEIGPHPALSGPVRQCLQDADMPKSPFNYVAPLQRNDHAVASVLALAGKLFECGVRLEWAAVSALSPGVEMATVRPDLPSYSWDHSSKHWQESRVARAYRLRKEPYHDLLGVPALDATALEPRWRHFLGQANLPWLSDHVVDGLTIFPGAGYLCMAIEGVAQLARQNFAQQVLETVALRDIAFKRGLVIPEGKRVELQLSMKPQSGSQLGFAFTITALAEGDEWYEHCTGIVEGVLAGDGVVTNVPHEEERPEMPADSDTYPHETLYHDMNAVGNTYGPAFAGLDSITLAADASQAAAAFRILDIQAMMPAKHQRPHIIHPSTLDLVFQGALPLVGRRLGRGSIMPVHVDELVIAVTPSLYKPGSALDVSTLLTSSHFRTAMADISVLANRQRHLAITGMEFRSLGSRDDGVNSAEHGEREICYKLNWRTAMEYARVEDLPTSPGLKDLIAHTAIKRHGLAIIGLGATVPLSEEFLEAVQANNKVTSHDFVDATPGRFDDAAERIKGFPVQFRTLRPGTNPVARGFEAGAYDLVLAASPKWLNQAAILVKSSGTIVLVLSPRDSKDNTWRAALKLTSTPMEEQMAFRDIEGRLIVMAKPAIPALPPRVHILTHSTRNATAWVSAVETDLRARGIDVSLATLSSSSVMALGNSGALGRDSTETVIIADDVADSPILADSETFDASIMLLTQSTRIVWVSPDDPAPFHQIEGFVRTAYAENDDLRLATVHISPKLLVQKSGHDRLFQVVGGAVAQVASADTPNVEREYRIDENGSVMVPRLQHSDELNLAIARNGDSGPETEMQHFTQIERSLVLSPDGSGRFSEHEKVLATALGDDEIEVEVQAMVLAKAGTAARQAEYAGVVGRVGSNVQSLASGDRVVALAAVIGAGRLRIPHSHAGRLSADYSATTASALLLHLMAASHALRGIARLLSSEGTVLIHGARTISGRAAIAIAKSIGVRVTATATDAAEAAILEEQLGINITDVLVAQRSVHRRPPRSVFPGGLDAVIQANEDPVPAEAMAHIKPFGSVVVVSPSYAVAVAPKLPFNVAFHFVDMAGLMQARLDLIAPLVAQATAALEHTPLAGLDIPVRDVADAAEALRLINTGVYNRAVLEVLPDSTVEVVLAAKPDGWATEDATYVIAGGLGDIGQRFLALMARRGAKHLATISRRAPNPETLHALRSKLEAIRPGTILYPLQADISSEYSVHAAAASLASQGAPPVRGVIQSAMVMIDRPVELTTFDDFTGVTQSKVAGTLNLRHVFGSPDLAFFLSLSSVASIVGAQAEASYNAGNALQDSLAHQAPHLAASTRFLTVNFGWVEDAALTADDEIRQGALRRAGFCPTRSEELGRFFDHILGVVVDPSASVAQAIIGFDAESLANATAHNGNIQSAMFGPVRERRTASANCHTETDAADSGQTFEQVIAEGDGEAVTEFIANATTVQLARLISVDASSIDARQGSILALGLDSLVAVELRNWIMRQFDAPLQSTEILAPQTVWGLAEKVVGRSKKMVRSVATE